MCGIAGRLADTPDGAGLVARMVNAIAFRGPDDLGLWADSGLGISLGHCRLSVIDPVHGHQPMTVRTHLGQEVIVTFGGEIYNHATLRNELLSRGYAFVGRTDTEVIGAGYLEWGTDLFTRLHGMFAIALWDTRQKELLLVRDPLGIKPLFYSSQSNQFLFASEQRSLLAAGVQAKVGTEGVCELLGLWPYKTPGGRVFDSIEEVGPGSYMVISRDAMETSVYWCLTRREHREDFTTTVAHVRSMMEDAVEEHLVADVPLTTLLSGGLDSSCVAALASRHGPGLDQGSAYTLELPDAEAEFRPTPFRPDSDRPFAADMASYLGLHLDRVSISDEEIIIAEELTTGARDVPDNADMDTTLLLLFRAIKGRYKVCLTGEGADEIFGGYTWYMSGAPTSAGFSYPWVEALCFPFDFIAQDLRRVVQAHQHASFMRTLASLPADLNAVEREEREGLVTSYLDLAVFLPGQLERMDRISMSQGVEARVPYCTPEFAMYCWSIPAEMKKHGGIEKGLLRQAASSMIPDSVRLRRKTSYPTARSHLYEGHLRQSAWRILDDKQWAFAEVLDLEAIRSILAGTRPAPTSRPSIWLGQLCSLYRWANAYSVEVST